MKSFYLDKFRYLYLNTYFKSIFQQVPTIHLYEKSKIRDLVYALCIFVQEGIQETYIIVPYAYSLYTRMKETV